MSPQGSKLPRSRTARSRQVLNEANQTRRELMRTTSSSFGPMMPNQPAAGTHQPRRPSRSRCGSHTTPWDKLDRDKAARQAQGGRGGRGGRGVLEVAVLTGTTTGVASNREAMQKVMEQPEVKANMEETRKQQSQLRDREYALVFRAMDRRQVAVFKKTAGQAL